MTQSLITVRETIFERIRECRQDIIQGKVDLSGIEQGVRAYCEAVASLPLDIAREHQPHLEALAGEVEALNMDLTVARDAVCGELDALDRLRQASAAYQRSDAMSHSYLKNKKGGA